MPAAVDTNDLAPAFTERREERYAWAPLALAVAPLVVAMARAVAGTWRPEYDAGYFYARALDVFTEHHPFVGAWSTSALFAETSFNNVGALQLVLLAPFARLGPEWVAVGVGLVNVAAVVCAWWSARQLFGPRGVVAVMAATVLIELAFGVMAFVDPRQQVALILPFWGLIWATLAVARGGHAALLPWLFFASLVMQTHFTYVFLAAVLVVVGTVGYLWTHRRRLTSPTVARWVVGSVAFAAVLWGMTLWDQFRGSGNLGRALRGGSDQPSVGLSEAARIVADGPVIAPWPGSLRGFHEPWTLSAGVAWLVVVAALGVLVVAAVLTPRSSVRLTLAVAAGLLVTGLATAARIPRTGSFGLLPQNYFWLWPIVFAGAIGLLAAVSDLIPRRSIAGAWAVAPLAVASVAAAPSGMVFPQWDLAAELRDVAGRSMLDELREGLDAARERVETGPAVVVHPTSLRLAIPDYYNVLGVVIAAGLDVRFPADADDLHRFGEERCEEGTERWQLRVVVGANRPELTGYDLVLADTAGRPESFTDELAARQDDMLELLRSGAFALDLDEAATTGPHAELRRILASPSRRHDDLWFWLPSVVGAGDATVPAGARRSYDRWLDLELARLSSTLLVYLTPNYFPGKGCPE